MIAYYGKSECIAEPPSYLMSFVMQCLNTQLPVEANSLEVAVRECT